MALGRRKPTTPSTAPEQRARSLVAAAAPVDITSQAQVKRIAARAQEWQDEAWAYFDALGAIRDPLTFRSNVISKVDLFAALLPEDGDDEPIPVSAAAETRVGEDGETLPPFITEAVARLADDTMDRLDDVPSLMRKLSLNLDVPGEAHVVGEEADGDETWRAYSDGELVTKSGKLSVKDDPKDKGRPVDPKAVVFRVWLPHPRWNALATSNMQALVNEGPCEELLLIAREMRAASKSRIGKGLLLVAEELSLSGGSIDDGTAAAELETAEGGDEFQREIIEWITETVGGEGTAYEVAPGVWRAPSDMIGAGSAVARIDLGQPLDSGVLERAKYLLDRVAQGINLPPEISKGMGDINHWGAWQVERSAFRAYMEPTVLAICQAMTVGFLRPMLLAAGLDEVTARRLVVWYDPADALTPENRVETATAGVNLGALSHAAWRREAQFDESDAPDNDEIVRIMASKRGILTAEITLLLAKLAELVPEEMGLPAPPGAEPPAPIELPPAPEPDDEGPPPDDTPADPEEAALTAAATLDVGDRLAEIDRRLFERVLIHADSAVERAVERAANRLRSAANRDPALKASARKVEGVTVGRVIGRANAVRLAAGDDTDEDEALAALLLVGAFTDLAARVDLLLERAQQAAVVEALALTSPPGSPGADTPTDAELVTLAEAQADDRDRATTFLTAALTTLALSVLFDGRPEQGDGEFDPSVTVPPGLVRETMAVGGGASNVDRNRSGGLTVEGRPVGGVATGERSRGLFARVQAWWSGYRWDYGDASTRHIPFEPHRRLNGKVFARWDSPELANTETSWLGASQYVPGDHAGCKCSFIPVVIDPQASS